MHTVTARSAGLPLVIGPMHIEEKAMKNKPMLDNGWQRRKLGFPL